MSPNSNVEALTPKVMEVGMAVGSFSFPCSPSLSPPGEDTERRQPSIRQEEGWHPLCWNPDLLDSPAFKSIILNSESLTQVQHSVFSVLGDA